jgi:hypothetical protein
VRRPVWALAPKGSRGLPVFALQKPIEGRFEVVGLAAWGCSTAYKEPLCVFPGRVRELRRPSEHADSRLSMHYYRWPPSRRHAEASTYGRTPSSTRLKPPLDKRQMPRVACGATCLRRREQHLYQPPFSVRQTFDTATQRYLILQNSNKSNTKILKTTQDTPWTRPTSTKPPTKAMRKG